MGDPRIVVIGGGIAGVTAAAELAEHGAEVTLLEAETQLAQHTTGRSAAMFLENYGPLTVRRLSMASRQSFAAPDSELADTVLWQPRSMLEVGGEAIADDLRTAATDMAKLVPSTELLDEAGALEVFPVLRPGVVAAAMHEPEAMELDVAAIHQLYVRRLKHVGGKVHTAAPVHAIARDGSGWIVQAAADRHRCDAVVNASGAWADRIATLADISTVGLRPLRRTACVATLDYPEMAHWPLVSFASTSATMDGYCKPEPGGLLVSPADEQPEEPTDTKPEEIDVARGIDVVSQWTTLELRHVRTAWAGQRSFVADRVPVVGEAPEHPGFFWLAGQGGYGIQTAPAIAQLLSSLLLGHEPTQALRDLGVEPADVAPDRPGLSGELVPG